MQMTPDWQALALRPAGQGFGDPCPHRCPSAPVPVAPLAAGGRRATPRPESPMDGSAESSARLWPDAGRPRPRPLGAAGACSFQAPQRRPTRGWAPTFGVLISQGLAPAPKRGVGSANWYGFGRPVRVQSGHSALTSGLPSESCGILPSSCAAPARQRPGGGARVGLFATLGVAKAARSRPDSRTLPLRGGCESSPRRVRIFSMTGRARMPTLLSPRLDDQSVVASACPKAVRQQYPLMAGTVSLMAYQIADPRRQTGHMTDLIQGMGVEQ